MSENKIATKADLQRMYNKILPYLGGMPEMVANKFSKGDLYSTEERMIGQWIDGKPLYQKTVDCGALPNNTTKNVVHNITNIDKIVTFYGLATRSSDGLAVRLPSFTLYNPSTGANYGVEVSVNKTQIILLTVTDRSAFSGYVTLQYTKTTDSPISIGSDTDYSTEEKIVGTWIDGKPIYQIVLTGNGSTPQRDNYIEIFSGVDTFIKGEGIIQPDSEHSRSITQTPINPTNGTGYWSTSIAHIHSTHKVELWVTSTVGNFTFDYTIILQYTKSTD